MSDCFLSSRLVYFYSLCSGGEWGDFAVEVTDINREERKCWVFSACNPRVLYFGRPFVLTNRTGQTQSQRAVVPAELQSSWKKPWGRCSQGGSTGVPDCTRTRCLPAACEHLPHTEMNSHRDSPSVCQHCVNTHRTQRNEQPQRSTCAEKGSEDEATGRKESVRCWPPADGGNRVSVWRRREVDVSGRHAAHVTNTATTPGAYPQPHARYIPKGPLLDSCKPTLLLKLEENQFITHHNQQVSYRRLKWLLNCGSS